MKSGKQSKTQTGPTVERSRQKDSENLIRICLEMSPQLHITRPESRQFDSWQELTQLIDSIFEQLRERWGSDPKMGQMEFGAFSLGKAVAALECYILQLQKMRSSIQDEPLGSPDSLAARPEGLILPKSLASEEELESFEIEFRFEILTILKFCESTAAQRSDFSVAAVKQLRVVAEKLLAEIEAASHITYRLVEKQPFEYVLVAEYDGTELDDDIRLVDSLTANQLTSLYIQIEILRPIVREAMIKKHSVQNPMLQMGDPIGRLLGSRFSGNESSAVTSPTNSESPSKPDQPDMPDLKANRISVFELFELHDLIPHLKGKEGFNDLSRQENELYDKIRRQPLYLNKRLMSFDGELKDLLCALIANAHQYNDKHGLAKLIYGSDSDKDAADGIIKKIYLLEAQLFKHFGLRRQKGQYCIARIGGKGQSQAEYSLNAEQLRSLKKPPNLELDNQTLDD